MNASLPFSRWIKRLRADLDVTQEQLAEQVGCSVDTIRAFETGRRRPSRAMSERLADVLVIPSDERAEFLRRARLAAELVDGPGPASLPTVPPASATAGARQALRLPVPPTALIGRATERAAIIGRIADPTCRLLTIVGAGGTGKTRLALQVASDMAGQFADGAVFVPLGQVLAAGHVAAAIADAVGCLLAATTTPEESLRAFLRDRELLLVLDNLEHLLDATPLLTALLVEAPNLHMLATSRERLRLHSEWIFELGGLTTPRSDARLEIERCDAVLLFLERARQVSNQFALTPSNRTAIARICRLLDGMPLGIELAAHWVRTLTPDEIASELERTLDLPDAGPRDLPHRHRSLRAVFDHSWHLLTATEQRVLCDLSVFRGGFGREAAEHVAQAALPSLVALTDKSLLRRAQTGRYDMHALVRRFAAAHMSDHTDWMDDTRGRHATYFANWLHQREAPLKAAMSDGEVVAELRAEIDNVWLAWDWMITHARADLLRQAAGCFAFFLEMRCLFREGITLFRRAAAALAERVPPTTFAESSTLRMTYSQMLGYQGWLAYRSGEYQRGRELLEQSFAVLQPEHDREALFVPVFGLGCVLLSSGEYERSHQLLTQSLEVARAAQNQWQIAYTLTMLGQLALAQGQWQQAHDILQQALAIWRVIGGGTSPCLNRLGLVLLTQNKYAQAEALLQESIVISSNRGDVEDTAAAMAMLGKAASLQEKFDEAVYLFHESLAMFREVGAPTRVARTLVDLGWTYHAQLNMQAAYGSFVDALRTAYDNQFVPIALDALYGIAYLAHTRQSPDDVLGIVLQIVQHPSTEQETRRQAQQLQADAEQRLSPTHVAVVYQTAAQQTFDAAVENVLKAGASIGT